jgi:hypothetical protein
MSNDETSVVMTKGPDKHVLSEDEKKTQEYVICYTLVTLSL